MLQRSILEKQTATSASTILKPISLSDYFPAGTRYFYGYPAGDTKQFLNTVPPAVEELVAARANWCADSNIGVINFSATCSDEISRDLLSTLGIPHNEELDVVTLPKNIDRDLVGAQRDEAIIDSLLHHVSPGSLVMAQPFKHNRMEFLYQISSAVTNYLNDKANIEAFIEPRYLPQKYGTYTSYATFEENIHGLVLPYVIKASSSSSGDGVYICHNTEDVAIALKKLKLFNGTILVEQYINVKENYGFHFGIPHDRHRPIDIIGINKQITSDKGEFLGGFIDTRAVPFELSEIKDYLIQVALPKIRSMGWYGAGGLDILLDANDKCFVIDGNFRMTGMSAYHFMISTGVIKPPLMSFAGEFYGTKDDFNKHVVRHFSKNSPHRIGQLIAVSCHNNKWHFNGAILYDTIDQLSDRVNTLLEDGIISSSLTYFSHM